MNSQRFSWFCLKLFSLLLPGLDWVPLDAEVLRQRFLSNRFMEAARSGESCEEVRVAEGDGRRAKRGFSWGPDSVSSYTNLWSMNDTMGCLTLRKWGRLSVQGILTWENISSIQELLLARTISSHQTGGWKYQLSIGGLGWGWGRHTPNLALCVKCFPSLDVGSSVSINSMWV